MDESRTGGEADESLGYKDDFEGGELSRNCDSVTWNMRNLEVTDFYACKICLQQHLKLHKGMCQN